MTIQKCPCEEVELKLVEVQEETHNEFVVEYMQENLDWIPSYENDVGDDLKDLVDDRRKEIVHEELGKINHAKDEPWEDAADHCPQLGKGVMIGSYSIEHTQEETKEYQLHQWTGRL